METMDEDSKRRKRELDTRVLEKVGEVITAIKNAKHIDSVVTALHSIAVLLFPIDSSLISGCIHQHYKYQILNVKAPSINERDEWWQSFYHGPAFSTLAHFLLHDVTSNWLACFPFSARKHFYDIFFVNGLMSEVVQTLVPCLQQSGSDGIEVKAFLSNAERLVVLCLLENNGVFQVAREFGVSCMCEGSANDWLRPTISRVAQLVASVPDKARPRASTSLTSHLFFKTITIQLLSGLQERAANLSDKFTTVNKIELDGTLLFVGETFSRICRRGSSDVLSSEVVLRVLRHIQSVLCSNSDVAPKDIFESNPESIVWSKMMEAIKDPYAVERMSEQLLHQLAIDNVTDSEAYWIIWLLFHQVFHQHMSIRSMFLDKFLLWKVFPICCLRWILQFAVFGCAPVADPLTKDNETQALLDTVERLVAVWSKREFVQSTTMEQQAYVTAAIGLCLGKLSKEELDKTKDVMHLILLGVSCRLESPNDMVRKMASSVAFMFSKLIDPKNPLYLDDSCTGETIDWEFGITTRDKESLQTSTSNGNNLNKMITASTSMPEKDLDCITHDEMLTNKKSGKNKLFENSIDPDEIIDPATLNYESVSDQDEDDEKASEDSDSSDSSLQPYDLSDDDNDLKRKFSQLVDLVGALRKSDDADGVERALDVAEELVRASPDELTHVAGDLAKTLVLVRCSDVAVEGEEESAEEKRHRALVALLVTCPFESLETLNKLLYSPHLDVSQRIIILDIMTEAAQELANSKIMKPKHQTRALISTISETQPWFLPSSSGPPGASAWKEISEAGTLLNWSTRYERELPLKPGLIKRGKTRRWNLKSANIQDNQMELSHNKFPVYAAAFMLPAMQGFDKKRHGVDLLERDFIVLGKLVYMLGVCIKCASMHPEASALAPALLDMLKSREVYHHKEAYVRKAVLFAASCVLVALHPSFVASALLEGNVELSNGLDWIRSWALDVVDSDTDRDCCTLALSCLQLHSEMALQASRALESAESTFKSKSVALPSSISKGKIIIPRSNVEY